MKGCLRVCWLAIVCAGCQTSQPRPTLDPFLRPPQVPPPPTGAAVPPNGTDPYYGAPPPAGTNYAPPGTNYPPPASSYAPPGSGYPPAGTNYAPPASSGTSTTPPPASYYRQSAASPRSLSSAGSPWTTSERGSSTPRSVGSSPAVNTVAANSAPPTSAPSASAPSTAAVAAAAPQTNRVTWASNNADATASSAAAVTPVSYQSEVPTDASSPSLAGVDNNNAGGANNNVDSVDITSLPQVRFAGGGNRSGTTVTARRPSEAAGLADPNTTTGPKTATGSDKPTGSGTAIAADGAGRSGWSHSADYSRLTGRLEYSQIHRRWKLRYLPIDGNSDKYGGSVVLSDSVKLADYQPGEVVTIEGSLDRVSPGAGSFAPTYRIEQIARGSL